VGHKRKKTNHTTRNKNKKSSAPHFLRISITGRSIKWQETSTDRHGWGTGSRVEVQGKLDPTFGDG
jgi:hypothetical protein